jgi:hypothetical protein
MIFGASRLRRVEWLGSLLVLVMVIGCGSSSDSSGTGGTSSTGNSNGGSVSGGSGNSVAGSANGQAGATGGTDSDDGSGEEGGAGNDDTPEGGSGGRGDDDSQGGANGGASDGGEPGGGEGGASESNPDVWTQCVNQDDCVLTPMTCCGQCSAVTPEDAAAVNAQYLSEFREAACGGPGICPACIAEDDPRVSTYCSEEGRCVVDLALD